VGRGEGGWRVEEYAVLCGGAQPQARASPLSIPPCSVPMQQWSKATNGCSHSPPSLQGSAAVSRCTAPQELTQEGAREGGKERGGLYHQGRGRGTGAILCLEPTPCIREPSKASPESFDLVLPFPTQRKASNPTQPNYY